MECRFAGRTGGRPSVLQTMRSWGMLWMSGLASVLAGCGPQVAVDTSQPRVLQFAGAHDFGTVPEGEELQHDFQVTNLTDHPIRFVGHVVTCACLSVEALPDVVPPHATVRLPTRLSTSRQQGSLAQKLIVSTDHPVTRELTFSVRALVKGIWANPTQVDFGIVVGAETCERTVSVYAAGFENAAVGEMAGADPGLRVGLRPAQFARSATHRHLRALGNIVMTLDPAALPVGPFRNSIRIEFAAADGKWIDVPVTAYKAGAIEATPATIVFGNIADRTGPVRNLVSVGEIG